MRELLASGRYQRAVEATVDLLGRLRIEAMFVGRVAEAAWMGGVVETGSVDLVALMTAQQRNQVATMASNRGWRVEREEIEQSEELDLVPLNFVDPDGDVRVHVLLASNALYGRMVAGSVAASAGGKEIRIPRAEDLALFLVMAEDHEGLRTLRALPGFDGQAFEERLTSIGLAGKAGDA